MTTSTAEKNSLTNTILTLIKRFARWLDQALKAAQLDNVRQQYLREAESNESSDRNETPST